MGDEVIFIILLFFIISVAIYKLFLRGNIKAKCKKIETVVSDVVFKIFVMMFKELKYQQFKTNILKNIGVPEIYYKDIDKQAETGIAKFLQRILQYNKGDFYSKYHSLIKKYLDSSNDYSENISLTLSDRNILSAIYDEYVIVGSSNALSEYSYKTFFPNNKEILTRAKRVIVWKTELAKTLQFFLDNNESKLDEQYIRLEEEIKQIVKKIGPCYKICVTHISEISGKLEIELRDISVNQYDIDSLIIEIEERQAEIQRLQKETALRIQKEKIETALRKKKEVEEYEKLKKEVFRNLNISESLGKLYWDICHSNMANANVDVKSRKALQNYDKIMFFKENREELSDAEKIITQKKDLLKNLTLFLDNNEFKSHCQYGQIQKEIENILEYLKSTNAYRICVTYAKTKYGREPKNGKLSSETLTKIETILHVSQRYRVKIYLFGAWVWLDDTCIKLSNPINLTIEFIKHGISLYFTTAKKPHHWNWNEDSYGFDYKIIEVTERDIERFTKDPTLLMSKAEYNKFLKNQKKEVLEQKQRIYYEKINDIIDYANDNREILLLKNSKEQLDTLMLQLYDKTVNNIKKIKTLDSEEWALIDKFIGHHKSEANKIVGLNQKLLTYYLSPDFNKIKNTCVALMGSQKEFNEYISEKVESISKYFGVRVVREETIIDDTYNYIRPYKKTITPFTAELSATVFASAENNPMAYIVKNFYPDKKLYPEQIQKLCRLVEELQTLRDAQKIIETYKAEYQQYLQNVPAFVIENDEAGFYSRLGFANIDESVLTVEYKFCYTSGGGMAKRSFTVPMTEETISELIKVLESKLTTTVFVKEQRILMTKKLRESIKIRDNYTCCHCGNSIHTEPNLLLEIDHIVPVSKGGYTVEDNLQTLCWKCNRAKSDKLDVE